VGFSDARSKFQRAISLIGRAGQRIASFAEAPDTGIPGAIQISAEGSSGVTLVPPAAGAPDGAVLLGPGGPVVGGAFTSPGDFAVNGVGLPAIIQILDGPLTVNEDLLVLDAWLIKTVAPGGVGSETTITYARNGDPAAPVAAAIDTNGVPLGGIARADQITLPGPRFALLSGDVIDVTRAGADPFSIPYLLVMRL
jgi:hypothetical protein